jgi:ABC-type Na+ efflux pump permease subunit
MAMFSEPMFRYEYRAATRNRRPFVFRSVIAAVLVAATLFIGFLVTTANPRATTEDNLATSGRCVFAATFCFQILFLTFFVPTFVGPSIAEERSKDTLPLLLLTRLSRIEIVLTKTVARWLSALNLILTALPILAAAAWVAGLPFELLLAVAVLVSSSAFMAALAALASAAREQAATARAQAVAWILGWLVGPPIVTIMPVRIANLWGMLLTEAKRLCFLIAPSSPLSLLTNPGWYNGTGSLDLESRVALMILLQVCFGLVAVALAASRLNAREANPNWADPARGYRPPCSDDPIYWREYELPMRKGGSSIVVLRLRYVWIAIKAILIMLVGLISTLLTLAIPIGLTAATFYYGVPAFEESWCGGPFTERIRFNVLVRGATGLLALFPAMAQGSFVGMRITLERDKKTWDILLATPLTGDEILRAKVRASLTLLKPNWPILLVWALGVASGAVSLLGVGLAAIDLLLLTWAFLAIGLYFVIKPGPTQAASSRSSMSTLILFVLHMAILAALLASPPEIDLFASWDIRIRAGVILTGIAVMAITGIVARRLTRQTFDRFEEWVGRPIWSDDSNRPAVLSGAQGPSASRTSSCTTT